jgi:hypothetical protein
VPFPRTQAAQQMTVRSANGLRSVSGRRLTRVPAESTVCPLSIEHTFQSNIHWLSHS